MSEVRARRRRRISPSASSSRTRAAVSETFLRHAELLPGSITVVHGFLPTIGDRPVLNTSLAGRGLRRIKRRLLSQSEHDEAVNAYAWLFKTKKPRVVLAEYGPTGVHVLEACRRLDIPLVVHFHGYDASETSVLNEQADGYARLFEEAAALVVVSRAMKHQLISLGAPWRKIHCNPCGVDCARFSGAAPGIAPPTLLSVGRFVVKKAPHLTIQAFAKTRDLVPDARLRMIGDGPLLASCRALVEDLGVQDSVTFLGAQPSDVVRKEMRAARAFVQHSAPGALGRFRGDAGERPGGGSLRPSHRLHAARGNPRGCARRRNRTARGRARHRRNGSRDAEDS